MQSQAIKSATKKGVLMGCVERVSFGRGHGRCQRGVRNGPPSQKADRCGMAIRGAEIFRTRFRLSLLTPPTLIVRAPTGSHRPGVPAISGAVQASSCLIPSDYGNNRENACLCATWGRGAGTMDRRVAVLLLALIGESWQCISDVPNALLPLCLTGTVCLLQGLPTRTRT